MLFMVICYVTGKRTEKNRTPDRSPPSPAKAGAPWLPPTHRTPPACLPFSQPVARGGVAVPVGGREGGRVERVAALGEADDVVRGAGEVV